MTVKQIFDPKQSKYATSLITSVIETILGTPLELRAAKESLKSSGKNIASKSEFFHTSKALFPSSLAKSYLTWLVINGDEESLAKKAFYGGLAGLVSAPIDSFGNKVMITASLGKGLMETYSQSLAQMDFRTVLRSAPYRGIVTAFISLVSSQQFGKALSDVIDPFVIEEKKDISLKEECPSSKIIPKNLQRLIEDAENINERLS